MEGGVSGESSVYVALASGSDDKEMDDLMPSRHWAWDHKAVFLATFLGSSGDAVAGSIYVLQHFKPFIKHRTYLLLGFMPLSFAFMYVLFKIDEVFIARAKIVEDNSGKDILKNTQESSYKRQVIHILHPCVYTFGALMACQAINVGLTATLVIAISNFTLQLVKSCQTYNEWAQERGACHSSPLEMRQYLLMYTWILNGVLLNLVRLLGVTELIVALWPMTELYIHANGLLNFLTEGVEAIDFAITDVHSNVINHVYYWWVAVIVSYLVGSSQSTYTRPYDVRKYRAILESVNHPQGSCCLAFLKIIAEKFSKSFANNAITGRLFDCIWITCVKHVLLGPRVLLWVDSIFKPITGLAMGAVAGLELFQILAGRDATLNEVRYEEMALMAFLCLAYGCANVLQVSAKKSSAQEELAQLAATDSFWGRPWCASTLKISDVPNDGQGLFEDVLHINKKGPKILPTNHFPRDSLCSKLNVATVALYLALGFAGHSLGAAVSQDWDWSVRLLPMASEVVTLSTVGTVLTGVSTSALLANSLYASAKALNVLCGSDRRRGSNYVGFSQFDDDPENSESMQMAGSVQSMGSENSFSQT